MENGDVHNTHVPAIHDPCFYRIRVAGRLGAAWSERIGGMSIVVREGATDRTCTELAGTIADQAALQGVLDLLYARGHVLLGVELVDDGFSFDKNAPPGWDTKANT